MVSCHLYNITCSTNFTQAQKNKKLKMLDTVTQIFHYMPQIALQLACLCKIFQISLILYHTHQNTSNQPIHSQHVHTTASVVQTVDCVLAPSYVVRSKARSLTFHGLSTGILYGKDSSL